MQSVMIFVFGNFSAETWNIYFGIMEAHYWTNGSLRAEYTVAPVMLEILKKASTAPNIKKGLVNNIIKQSLK